MSKYGQNENNDEKNKNGEDCFAEMLNEGRELLKRAISEALDSKIRKIEEETKDMKMPPYSRRHRTKMNRLFRERAGSSHLPFPEVDNVYERVRSKLVIKFKTDARRKNADKK